MHPEHGSEKEAQPPSRKSIEALQGVVDAYFSRNLEERESPPRYVASQFTPDTGPHLLIEKFYSPKEEGSEELAPSIRLTQSDRDDIGTKKVYTLYSDGRIEGFMGMKDVGEDESTEKEEGHRWVLIDKEPAVSKEEAEFQRESGFSFVSQDDVDRLSRLVTEALMHRQAFEEQLAREKNSELSKAQEPFFDQEDYDSSEASKETITQIHEEIDQIRKRLPKLSVGSTVNFGKVELSAHDDHVFLTAVEEDPPFHYGLRIYHEGAEELVMKETGASFVFFPPEKEERDVFINVQPEKLKKYQETDWLTQFMRETRENEELKGAEPEEVLERFRDAAKDSARKEKEAEKMAESTGLDFVSEKTAQKLLELSRELKAGLTLEREE